jgi:hypothetical protein
MTKRKRRNSLPSMELSLTRSLTQNLGLSEYTFRLIPFQKC